MSHAGLVEFRIMKTAAFITLMTMIVPTASHAADDDEYLRVCEKIIASRQRVPDLYNRIAYDLDRHVLTWEEHLTELRNMRAPDKLIEKNQGRFESGEFTPTNIKIVVDYEATDASSTVVRKRSLCEFRENTVDSKAYEELAVVDGTMIINWKPEN